MFFLINQATNNNSQKLVINQHLIKINYLTSSASQSFAKDFL